MRDDAMTILMVERNAPLHIVFGRKVLFTGNFALFSFIKQASIPYSC
jgi:hypothetical protein